MENELFPTRVGDRALNCHPGTVSYIFVTACVLCFSVNSLTVVDTVLSLGSLVGTLNPPFPLVNIRYQATNNNLASAETLNQAS